MVSIVDDIQPAARALKALAHPLRLHILCVLADSEVNVQEIVSEVGTSQSNISQHLAILREKGIITARKDANRVYYRVQDKRILNLIGMMRDVFAAPRYPRALP
ncbi:MAG: winged helix-turn-helix transcriptional regulator [Xanthomonadaceae bacterium]|nr:winged helix-turn-helix transcriptional regulator [Xanthomonadaceae bacterium]